MDDKYNSKSKGELWSNKKRNRSRSRSPRRKEKSSRDHASLNDNRRDERRKSRSSSSSSSSSGNGRRNKRYEKLDAPPAPVISKISINLKSNKSSTSSSGKLQMKLNVPAVVKPTVPIVAKPSVFNVDSDDDDTEEMPAECKMRMRNIGKNTPTSSGPNSFGKTKIGFVDSKKIFEKKLMELAKNLGD